MRMRAAVAMTQRFVVGIDLGTTNSALAWIDTGMPAEDARIEVLQVPQLVNPGEVGRRALLPSFLYVPGDLDFPAGSTALPWDPAPAHVVGELARGRGGENAMRLVSSAKSWLSFGGANRTAPILPWGAPDEVTHLSPVDASAAYLRHLAAAFDGEIAGGKRAASLAQQDVLLTVPASFDEEARELTIRAAAAAGLKHVTLLEEPQAAFYAWLDALGDGWRRRVTVGDLILVCDVGGGTTDFSLIAVSERGGDLTLDRVAVGEHILLGGDNMDLALAHAVGATLPAGWDGLDSGQRLGLTYACRAAKEALFVDPARASAPVAVLGRGSKVIGGSLKTELTRALLDATLLDGFFPRCAPTDHPIRGRRVGLTEIGLPYASDPAITRHLARFLDRQGDALHAAESFVTPSAILFNGGVFKALDLRGRVAEVLGAWAGRPVVTLDNADPDLAVAIGAAYYGLVRGGRGIRIRGGVPRAYYVGIESSAPAVPGVAPPIKALCVVPMGMEEGTEADVPGPEFGLVVGEPAEFRFLGSTVRRDDRPGAVLDRWQVDELQELDPLEATLTTDDGRPGEVVPVRLHAHVTEVGTLDLWCQHTKGPGRWKLQYNVREGEE